MKNKVICILIGMGIMGALVGCGQAIQTVSAGENGYLKYCGKQDILGTNYRVVEVYEDEEHGNVVYVTENGHGDSIPIAVVPKHAK